MTPIRALFIIGTRPEAIKLAPVILAMKEFKDRFIPVVCATGQHREMLRDSMQSFNIEADFSLDVMRSNQDLATLTSSLLTGIDSVLASCKPDIVIVQGDTTSAMSGAIASFYRNIPIAHVEAGLRTRNLRNPFPEEGNRQIIDRLASVLFAPTEQNRTELLSEGILPSSIYVTGNTGIDALMIMRELIRRNPSIVSSDSWGPASPCFQPTAGPLALITLHRRESFGVAMQDLMDVLSTLATRYSAWKFLYPVHLNPNVSAIAKESFSGKENVHLCDPLDYPHFVVAMERASLLITDSGGIQEEAPSLFKPIVVLRDFTERREAVDAGTVILAGTSPDRVTSALAPLLSDPALCTNWPRRPNPYGDGFAANRILDTILMHFAK